MSEERKGRSLVSPPEAGDLAPNSDSDSNDIALDVRSKILSSLKSFENRLLVLLAEDPSEEGPTPRHIPEILDEQRDLLRLEVYEELRNLFLQSSAKGQLSSRVYEEAVYCLITDRLTRDFGYYQALMRAQEELRKRNSDIGDPKALEVDFDDLQKLLSGLDEVDFVRNMGQSLGMDPDDLNKVVDFTIRREFAPLRR